MQLYYNDVALHDLGKVIMSGQQWAGEPEEAPQAWRRTLRVKIHVHEPTFEDNYALVEEVRRALLQQQAVLKWVDGNGSVLLEQTATLTAHDWPEDEKVTTWFQALNLTFTCYEDLNATQNASLTATYQRTGESTPIITLGHVEKVKIEDEVQRYSAFRSHRESSIARVTLSGKFRVSSRLGLAERRAALQAAWSAMRAEIIDGSEGQLTYGTVLDQTVRITAFVPDLDQEVNYIPWSMTAQFTSFPNEAGYAQAQFHVITREDDREGKQKISLTGEIASESKVNAMAKLAAIRAAWANGYARLNAEVRDERIDGADGASFIKLTFSEEYESVANNVTWELRMSDAEEVTGAQIRRTYSGFVEAISRESFDEAYRMATAKALALGDDKHQHQVTRNLSCTDAQQSHDRQVTTTDIRCRVEFNFEYRLKGSRVYLEVANRFTRETFGLDSEQISGFVVAGDVSTARNLISGPDGIKIKTLGSKKIRTEEISEPRIFIGDDPATTIALGNAGTTRMPPEAGVWPGVSENVNTTETAGSAAEGGPTSITPITFTGIGSYARQWVRLDFSWTIHRAKGTSATQVAMRYTLEVSKDYQNNEMITSIPDGVIWAGNETVAQDYLTGFLATLGIAGSKLFLRTAAVRERFPGYTSAVASATADTFQSFSFSVSYSAPLTPEQSILESEISEEIQCSGKRLNVQPTATSYDVLQGANGECGTASGSRTISGSVTAKDETSALGWLKRQQFYPRPAGFAFAGDWDAKVPPMISFEPRLIPLVDGETTALDGTKKGGVGRTGDYNGLYLVQNFKAVRCRFRFTELHREITLI